ncbi:hypothetical protein [Natronorubrum halophilum]|uniref:hypothetical protein n=1 Tax=Natronorubrum halophilum TaxID=1702106 RepID=UPI001485B5CB|nr:hypothetical protein [Natronorubrum halophilum]
MSESRTASRTARDERAERGGSDASESAGEDVETVVASAYRTLVRKSIAAA